MSLFLSTLLIIAVFFDGVPVNCLVDTGADATVISQSTASRINTLSAPVAGISISGVGGGAFQGTYRWAPNIGNSSFGWQGAWIVIAPDNALPGNCILGADLLSQQPIVIDWHGHTVRPA